MKKDKEVVMAAVRQDGWALGYAAKEVVMAAVQQNGWALQDAALKADSWRRLGLSAVVRHTASSLFVKARIIHCIP